VKQCKLRTFNITKYSRADSRVIRLNDEQTSVLRTPVFLVIEEINTCEVRPAVMFISSDMSLNNDDNNNTERIVVSPVK